MPASPSLLIVPARFKTGKLYTQIATTSAGVVLGSSGDFNVTRATTATRFNSAGLIESVASGVPRLDYYTSGGTAGCPALLVEASGSNGILNSADTATNWTLGANLTSGYTDVIGVSGNNLTVAVSGSNIGAAPGRMQRTSNNVALASGSTYTISFLMRQTGTHTIGGYYAVITGGAAGDLGGGFSVSGSFSSGSTYNSAGTTNRIRRVERWGTDVFRCSETFTMTASGTLTSFNFAPLVSETSSLNPAVGTTMGFAAPQLELGSVPTSFIPTTTGSITRNADVVSVSGAVSGSIGQTQGTIYLDLTVLGKGSSSATPWVQIFGPSNNIGLAINSSNLFRSIVNTQSDTLLTAPLISSGVKVAWAYDATGTTCFINGTQYTLTTGGNQTMSSLTSISIDGSANTAFGFARIRAAALYTTRLTNAELQSLTTL